MNKKGFTLVEVIVVLVILAILAAILIPSLTGYIDKANQKVVVAECRAAVLAAQTLASEAYGTNKTASPTIATADVETLAELAKDTVKSVTFDTGAATTAGKFKVTQLVYTHGGYTCTYDTAATTLFTTTDAAAPAGE